MENQEKHPKEFICCESFQKIATKFKWMATGIDGEPVYLMPHIIINGERIRINNCPSCENYIRDIKLTREQFKELM